MKTYMVVYFLAAMVAMLLLPIISRLAKKLSLVDSPGVRKVHKDPIPRVGGIVFLVASYALILPVFFLDNTIGESFRSAQNELITLLVAGGFIFAVGLYDDLCPVRAKIKFLCLILASVAICASGATVHSISLSSSYELNFDWWISWPLAILWITTITVGMNFIDGLDGLAGGIAAIVCGAIAVLAFWNGQLAMGVIMLALLGSLTGFLFFNFHPAKIFMGDGGAMFLGFMIGAGSLACQAKTVTLVGVSLPFLVLGVPILDTAFTMIRRGIVYRRSIFAAERGHLHHRLLDMGLSQPVAVAVIYAATIISASFGVFMLTTEGGLSIGLLIGGIVFLFAFFTFLGAARIRETIAALKLKKDFSRDRKADQNRFEDTQLRLGEAKGFDSWWDSMCYFAKEMGFHSMAYMLREDNRISLKHIWNESSGKRSKARLAECVLPFDKKDSDIIPELKVSIKIAGSLESQCRQLALLGRLVDEFPPPAEVKNKDQKANSTIEDGVVKEKEGPEDKDMTGALPC